MSDIDKFSIKETPATEAETPSQEMLISDAMKELGMTVEDAVAIVDSLFASGVYKESFVISNNVCELRTRTTEEEARLHRLIAKFKDEPYDARMYEIQLHNLATSLTKLGNRPLKQGLDTESYEDRRKAVLTLPVPVFTMLSMALSKFDMKVSLACQDGILKTF